MFIAPSAAVERLLSVKCNLLSRPLLLSNEAWDMTLNTHVPYGHVLLFMAARMDVQNSRLILKTSIRQLGDEQLGDEC